MEIAIEERAARIKALILDVDGVLTDGRIAMNDRGEETKSFDAKDGQGLKMLISSGVEVILITGRRSGAVVHRSKDLGIEAVHQGVMDKRTLLRGLIIDKGLNRQEVCCMGDDIPDLAMFDEVGLRLAVADAVGEVREKADLIITKRGGRGAVREACEWLLKCRGEWDAALTTFTGE